MCFHRYSKANHNTIHFWDDNLKPKEDRNCLTFSKASGGYLNMCWGNRASCTSITAQDLIELAAHLKKNSNITPEAKEYLKRMMIWWLAQNENNISL